MGRWPPFLYEVVMNIKYLVVHCSDSPHGRGDTAKNIHQWHQERGFDGIGYHAVICEDGTIEMGRPLYWQGAHEKSVNKSSISVCLIGQGIYTNEQWIGLRVLLRAWRRDYPDAEIIGHNNLRYDKTCPMFDVKAWVKEEGL